MACHTRCFLHLDDNIKEDAHKPMVQHSTSAFSNQNIWFFLQLHFQNSEMLNALRLLIAVTLVLKVSWACRENQADQLAKRLDFGSYINPDQQISWNPYYYNYQSNVAVPVFREPFMESRTPTNYYFKSDEESQNLPADTRAFGTNAVNFINRILFNNRFPTPTNTFRPLAALSNQLPIQTNPNFVNPFYESCTAPSGESGICASGSVCSLFGGRPSGSCPFAKVCCINVITTCGATTTLNNTIWQSPTTAVGSPSNCALTVKMDTTFVEQKKRICQVRLDFVSFSIDQPAASSVCINDNFQVGGAVNPVPTICGDNNGQHMYIEVPPSDTNPSDLQLLFNFGSTAATRSWNIKISMLPCGASYLAPTDCLQYFTSATGRVTSFNWAAAGTSTRQLANQNYNICFRTEVTDNNQRATRTCLTVCNGNAPFSLSRPIAVGNSGSGATCTTDYILFNDGLASPANANPAADRYCGSNFNNLDNQPVPAVTVCSRVRPFRITYSTNGDEGLTAGTIETNNAGFCFNFQEL